MLKHKTLLVTLILVIFFIVSTVSAESDLTCHSQVKDGEKLLKTLQMEYDQTKQMVADFNQTSVIKSLDLEEESRGSLWIEKPGRVKWYYEQPEEQYYLISGESFSHWQVLDHQVNISDLKDANLKNMPISFLAGLGSLVKDFELTKACLDIENNPFFYLKPLKRESDIQQLILRASADSSQITGLSFSDESGNVNILSFHNIKLNSKLDSSIFSLQYPKDVYINDQRK